MTVNGRGRSGRGRGGRGRGGRGSGRSNQHFHRTDRNKFDVGTAKNTTNYIEVKDYLLNKIQKEYPKGMEVKMALEDEKDYNWEQHKPKLQSSEEEDAAQKQANEITFKIEVQQYLSDQAKYKESKMKAYALLIEHCTKHLKDKVYQKDTFETEIKNNPIELLKCIKEYSINPQDKRYAVATIFDAMKNFVNCRQQDDESLTDYSARFKQQWEILENHMGSNFQLKKHAEWLISKKKSKTKEQANKEANYQFLGYVFLHNSHQMKYKSIMDHLSRQYTFGSDEYPDSLEAARGILNNSNYDKSWSEYIKKKNNQSTTNSSSTNSDDTPQLSFNQLAEGACWACGGKGHTSQYCRKKKHIPREEWAISKAQAQAIQHSQTQTGDNNSDQRSQAPSSSNSDEISVPGSVSARSTNNGNNSSWQGVQFCAHQTGVSATQSFND